MNNFSRSRNGLKKPILGVLDCGGGKFGARHMEHEWDVLGDAEVEDIVGNIQDLIGIPHLMVEEVSFDNETPKGIKHQRIEDNSYTWMFIFANKKDML